MINKAIALYTIIDDLLKAIGHEQDPRAKMSDAEVITTMLIAAIEFAGNFRKAMDFMKESGLIPNMLSKSRFCRRAHALEELVNDLFLQIGMLLKEANIHMQYIIDSFPVPICDNIRISRCRIVTGEEFRGYIPSKKRYFYGVYTFAVFPEIRGGKTRAEERVCSEMGSRKHQFSGRNPQDGLQFGLSILQVRDFSGLGR